MAKNNRKERDDDTPDTYFIPPNYVDSSGVFGGMFRLRNAIEALAIGALIGLPLFSITSGLGLTIRVTILLAGVIPLMFLAAIGVMGLSITEFLYFAFRFLFKRRIIGRKAYDAEVEKETAERLLRNSNSNNSNNSSSGGSGYGSVGNDDEDNIPTSQFERLIKRFKGRSKGGVRTISDTKSNTKSNITPRTKTAARTSKRTTIKPKSSLYDKFTAIQKNGLKGLSSLGSANKGHLTGNLTGKFNGNNSTNNSYRPINEPTTYIPIKAIKSGIIYTTDNRYVKIIEVTPINFLLRTPKEQRNIIWSFVSFLKISPVKMQIKCLSKKADIEKHLNIARADLEKETNEQCRELQKDYMNLLYDIGSKEAVSRRFFIIFEYEPYMRAKDIEADAIANLNTIANTARTYLAQCGNDIVKHEDEDEFAVEALYQMLNRKTSFDVSLSQRKREVIMEYAVGYGKGVGGSMGNTVVSNGNNDSNNNSSNQIEHMHSQTSSHKPLYSTKGNTKHNNKNSTKPSSQSSKTNIQTIINNIPPIEYAAPKYIDFSRINYIKMDGVYISYLIVPTHGFRTQVQAGWVSLLVNAGEGIDIDIYLSKEPKEKVSQSLGRHIRMNKSKIKDASDTNDDFEDLAGSIHGGYYMKRGIANNEDFYYINMLVTITGATKEILDWRVREMQKKLVSQDMSVQMCTFRMEDAFLSSLPLAHIEKRLQKWSRRNMLTSGAASCYPLTSFEMCDDNGILLGVNKHNQSLIMVDIFNSKVYKNANMSILGTSGAGKTFTLQLMATRMRRKGIQVFILAPLKGHEFYRTCNTIGGSFIQISPSSKHCINIMEIRPVDTAATELIDEVVLDRSLLATKIDRLHIFFSLLIPDMNHEERQLLDEAIVRTYNTFGITHDNESLVEWEDASYKVSNNSQSANIEQPFNSNNTPYTNQHTQSTSSKVKFKQMPILGDLYNLLIEKEETKRMANIINRLVHGSASTFNQQTNVNLDNKYVVMDISELTGDLLTVGMFVALDFVWDKSKEDRTKEKAIFIDETWRLIGASSNRMAAEFVLEIFKIIRGYGGSAICATQDISDFFALEDGKYGKGIINNCKTKIILNLEDDEADRVQEILGLSESERQAIIHFERGNAMISANKNNVTVEVKPSAKELELITTDRRELQAIAERRKVALEHERLMVEAVGVVGRLG